ncbi:Nif11-like leader peptide family natural product precursor [Altericista sp. CCNU0014]|uniref:Nif11-like leader peptide family natural product precursor n=1 Tax=Altericista sp. CCNU0014 TaxID=3082949 RepID=UPI003850D692
MSIEAVQNFYQRLASDPVFYSELQQSKTKDDCRAIVRAAGYDFTPTELTDYTAALLEPKTAKAELNPLGERELAAVVGGAIALTVSPTVMPPYGHVPLRF